LLSTGSFGAWTEYYVIGFTNSNNLANEMDKREIVAETAMSYLKPGLSVSSPSGVENKKLNNYNEL